MTQGMQRFLTRVWQPTRQEKQSAEEASISCDANSQLSRDRYPLTKDWGKPEYVGCVQPFTWSELVAAYKASKETRRSSRQTVSTYNPSYNLSFTSGGLGELADSRDGYQVPMIA
jgi:hypothetical protein